MNTQIKELSNHDLAVITSLHEAESGISQREIARRTGLSVGLINAVIKKLVNTGYVKTSHLNRRSLDYLLTPQGFAQAAMKSYRYVLTTVKSFRRIQIQLASLLEQLNAEGVKEFYLNGNCELAELVSTFFEDGNWGTLYKGLPESGTSKVVVLNANPILQNGNKYRVVDLTTELANGKSLSRRK